VFVRCGSCSPQMQAVLQASACPSARLAAASTYTTTSLFFLLAHWLVFPCGPPVLATCSPVGLPGRQGRRPLAVVPLLLEVSDVVG